MIFLLVLDLEGKDEIIEFPLILIDLSSMTEISRFHSWIRPTNWDQTIPKHHKSDTDYVNLKSEAVRFDKALQSMHAWLHTFWVYLNVNEI